MISKKSTFNPTLQNLSNFKNFYLKQLKVKNHLCQLLFFIQLLYRLSIILTTASPKNCRAKTIIKISIVATNVKVLLLR